MKNTLLLTLILLLAGCITPGKVADYLDKPKNKPEADVIIGTYTDKNPDFAARLADKYLKESTDTNTETQKGNTEDFQNETGKALAEADKELENLNNKPVDPNCSACVAEQNKVIAKLQSTIRNLHEKAANLKPDTQTKTITKYVENNAKAEEWRLKQVAQLDSTSKYKALYQVKSEDYANLKKSLTRAYWFGAILVIVMAGMLFLLFKR